jgi:hypothetical protein
MNDADEIRSFMTRLASSPPAEQSSLDPGVLWWKAQLLRRWQAERRVQAPIDFMEPVQIATGLAAAMLLLTWSLPAVIRLLSLVHI